MNQYLEFWKKDLLSNKTRDVVYKAALDEWERVHGKSEINILEIGAARDLKESSRYSDGWSSIFWAWFIKTFSEYSGKLTICDINNEGLMNAQKLLAGWAGFTQYWLKDGKELLTQDKSYNFIYLDGSDDPTEMLEQYKICPRDSVVLCDDFHVKGSKLREYEHNFILYVWKSGHEMALYSPNIAKRIVKVEEEL